MRVIKMIPIFAAASLLTGCLSFGSGHDDYNKPVTYEQALQKEVAELLKSYRMCLQKNEDNPQKAKENCQAYHDAIADLAPPESKNSIGAFLDRLLKRDRSARYD